MTVPALPLLKLHIEERASPELVRTEFWHPLNKRWLICARGRKAEDPVNQGTFLWTSATCALTLLFLRVRARTNKPHLSGPKGSLATSLDYAISKQPIWLLDVFGVDSKGQSLAKRMFSRTNSNQKRPGPTTVSLNISMMPLTSIQIMCEGRLMQDEKELKAVAVAVECQWIRLHKHHTLKSNKPSKIGDRHLSRERPREMNCVSVRERLKTSFLQELEKGLFVTDAFSKIRLTQSLSSLVSNSLFARASGGATRLLSDVDLALTTAGINGFPREESFVARSLRNSRPLRIAVGPGGITAIAIFEFLKNFRHYNFELDYRYANSQDIRQAIIDGTFADSADAVIMAVSCAARLLSQTKQFVPLMIMPMTSHRILTFDEGRTSRSVVPKEFVFLTDFLSSASFYFEDMVASKKVSRDNVKLSHVDADEILLKLKEGGAASRAILWWPYYQFQEIMGADLVNAQLESNWIYDLTILFVHEALAKDIKRAQALDIAIRDGWLSLQESRTQRKEFVEKLFSDGEYLTFLCRCNGYRSMEMLRQSNE